VLCVLLSAWVAHAVAAPAAINTLRALNISAQTDGRLIVKATLNQPIKTLPEGVLLNDPDRLYFDLDQVASALGESGKIPGRGVVKNIDVVPAEGRTRLVINLSKAVKYET